VTTEAQESGELSRPIPSDSDLARLLAFLDGAGYERRDEDVPARDVLVYYLTEVILRFAERITTRCSITG
jgi:hypothetical protein